jgi:BNR/Asp-box repeat
MTNGDDTVLTIGTIKGLFLAFSDGGRENWRLEGPYFEGRQVYSAAFDGAKERIWASATSMHWGAELFHSDDMGKSWSAPEQPLIQFPEDSGESLDNIWQIMPSGDGTIYAGVQPACLFVSHDDGESWKPQDGFYNHPHRKQFMPGGGGLCLHTIIQNSADPKMMWVAVSTGGVYRTDDGGETWNPKNKGIRAPFLPDPFPEFGQCVHKVAQHPKKANVLYLQHHWGVYRSEDFGDSWQDIGKELPSDFGFAMAVSPVEPFNLYVLPLKSDGFRVCPDGKLAVYRTSDSFEGWECLDNGLPSENCFETILRDGMAVDSNETTGIYFGTRNGKIWGSNNAGGEWKLLFDSLPAVLNVKAYSTV